MYELSAAEVKAVDGGILPIVIASVEIASGLIGLYEGGKALGHYLYS
jgi:lactobin A/cerein 7B family class IIb bacteriocin